jgi:integrase
MSGSRMFTKKEISIMIDKAPPREKVFVLIGVYMGTRRSEALALKFKDIRGKKYLTIKGVKGGDVQQYPIPPLLAEKVEALYLWYSEEHGIPVTDDDYLFLCVGTRSKGRKLTIWGASELFKSMVDSFGFEGVSPHGLRKAFITSIYKLTGRDLALTRIYSRHKSLSNLQYYIDVGTDTGLVEKLRWE